MRLSFVDTLIKWRHFLYASGLVSALVGLFVVFTAPKRYVASASLLPALDEGTTVLMGTMATGLSSVLSGLLVTPSDIYLDLLDSRTVKEELIRRKGLQKRLGASNMDDALKLLDERLSVSYSTSGIIHITYEDTDPEFAASVVDEMLKILDSLNLNIIKTKGGQLREYLEGHVREVKDSIIAIQDSLTKIQETYKTSGTPEELSQLLGTYAGLKAQLLIKEMNLGEALAYMEPDNPEITRLKREIESIKAKLKSIEEGSTEGFGAGFGVALAKYPKVMNEIVKLQAYLEAYQEVLAIVMEELEKARILEKRQVPTFEIVDHPRPPQRKTWPKRSIFLVATVFIAAVGAMGFSLWTEGSQRAMADASSGVGKVLRVIKEDLSFRRKKG